MARDRVIEADPRDGRKYRARVWDDRKVTKGGALGAYRTRSGFTTKGAARAWCAEQEADVAVGNPAPVRGLTVGVELDGWLALQEGTVTKRRTFVVRKTELARVPAWLRARPLHALLPSECATWRGVLMRDYSANTARQTFGTFARALDAAVADRRLGMNPARNLPRVPRAAAKKRADDAMTPELIATMRAALPAPYRIAVELMYGAGLRLGEACGLTLDRVDFLRKTVRVDRQWSPDAELPEPGRNGASHGYGFAPPKGERSDRTVPVSDAFLAAVNAHIAEHGTGTLGTVMRLASSRRPVTEQQWHDVWTAAAERAGVSARWTAHDLRHAFGSAHYNAGTPAPTVARWMGHSVETFTRTYAHPEERHERPLIDTVALVHEAEAAGNRVPNVYRMAQ